MIVKKFHFTIFIFLLANLLPMANAEEPLPFETLSCGEILREKDFRVVYKSAFNRIVDTSKLTKKENQILEIVLSESNDLAPATDWIMKKGSGSANYNSELYLMTAFQENFHEWIKVLEQSGLFMDSQIDSIDMVFFIKIILTSGKPDVQLISNLSLIVDNIFGSNLYFTKQFLPYLHDLGDFMKLRRELAIVQSTIYAKANWDKILKNNKEILPTLKQEFSSSLHVSKKDGRVSIMEWITEYPLSLIPPVKKLVKDIFALVQPVGPVDPIAVNIAKRYLEEPWMPKALTDLRVILENRKLTLERAVNFDPRWRKEDLYHLALESTDGDSERAVVLLGLMSIQRKALIRNLSSHYKHSGTLKKYAQSLIDSVALYYLITDIAVHMQSFVDPAGYEVANNFIYPNGYNDANTKFYHFWSEAFLSYQLRKMGYSKSMVNFGLTSVGATYEIFTSIVGTQIYQSIGMGVWESFLATKMLSDITLHNMGAKFGNQIFDENQRENKVWYSEPSASPPSDFIFDAGERVFIPVEDK